MSLQRNYYEVLGVPQAATTDQIKKKYRELARTWHPDVVKDKDMGQRVFSQINQAYRILGDPDRRAQYNSTLAAASAAGNGASANGASANGTGTASGTAQAARPYSNGAAAPPQEQPVTPQKQQAIAGLLANADNASMAGKPIEAGAFCMKVLEIDPRNVRALDILGDALVQMGKREEAAVQYRKALQVAPSHSIQAKLNRLDQAAPSTRTRPIETTTAQSPAAKKPEAKKPDVKKPDVKKPDPAPSGADKAAGLFGRFLGRK